MIPSHKISPFKSHIEDFHTDLSGKAGRTTQEIKSLIGDKPLHKLSSNENALGPSPKALAAIQQALPHLHEYGYRIDTPLREALAAHFDHEIGVDQFITGNSGLEIIDMVARAFLEPGTESILSNPTFHVYEMFTEINGAQVVDVPLREGSFDLDVAGILDAVNPRTRLIFIANPNNPTGVMIPKSTLDEIVYNVPEHVIIIHDEVYWHFADLAAFPFAKDYIREGKQVIGLHSFSKAYGLAGLRVGYGFSTPRIAAYLQKLRRPFFINTLSMEGALAALGDEEHLRRTQALIAAEKQWLYGQFDRLGIAYWPSHTNFILFRAPGETAALVEQLLQQGILVRSGDNNGAAGCIRLTIGTHEANQAFVDALTRYRSKWPMSMPTVNSLVLPKTRTLEVAAGMKSAE